MTAFKALCLAAFVVGFILWIRKRKARRHAIRCALVDFASFVARSKAGVGAPGDKMPAILKDISDKTGVALKPTFDDFGNVTDYG